MRFVAKTIIGLALAVFAAGGGAVVAVLLAPFALIALAFVGIRVEHWQLIAAGIGALGGLAVLSLMWLERDEIREMLGIGD